MKKIVMLLLCTFLFGAEYRDFAKTMTYETEYKTALNKAKKEDKKLMVLMISNFCPWCTKFENKTLADESVDIAVKSKYIPLIINKEEKNFPAYLTTPIVPTTYFINPNKEEILHQSVGFSNKVEFLNLLQKLK
ncbi:MAG: thioredoxin family protein [Sulfurimonas sp.]|jgi:thioredoxin-related protein